MSHPFLATISIFLCCFLIASNGCSKNSTNETTNENTDNQIEQVSQQTTESPQSGETQTGSQTGSQIAAPTVVNSIAIIDINEVAIRAGIMDQINSDVKRREIDVEQRFKKLQSSLTEQYNLEVQKVGETPSPADTEKLNSLRQAHLKQMDAEWVSLQNELTEYHNSLKEAFLRNVKPVAQAVANSRGCTTVLSTKQVFHYNTEDEITNLVAKQMSQAMMRAAQSKQKEATRIGKLEDGGSFDPTTIK